MGDDGQKSEALSQILERMFSGSYTGDEFSVVAQEQVILSRESCPEILLPVNKLSEVILVQKFSQQHSKRLLSVDDTEKFVSGMNAKNSSTPGHRNGDSNGVDLDVTGSPLKCPFSLNDEASELSPFSITFPSTKKSKKKNVLSYVPLPVEKARLVASQLNLSLGKAVKGTEEAIPVWIACDGKDKQGTLFFGLHRSSDEACRVMITSSGPFDSFDALPSLDHLKLHLLAGCPSKRVDSSVKATYVVLFGEDENEHSSVNLTCSWRRPLSILTSPSLDAHTTAQIRIVCGDARSAAYQMYQELSALQGFVTGLSTGEVSWFVREGENSVADEIESIFTTIKEKAQRQKKEDDGSHNFDKMVEDKFYSRRQNMDFTDLLWSVLMKCESYNDLTVNLEGVFNAISSGQIRPQIHVRNKTQIGTLSRSLMRGQSEQPTLTGITPLQMLVEIGIEKIKRDYINIFQAGELARGDQLSHFVNNSDESLDNMVHLLGKLHVALQVVVLLHTHLNLPPASLAHFTAEALNKLKEEDCCEPYMFDFKLETTTVHKFLSSFKPSSWEVSLDSSHPQYSKSLVCHISQQPLIKFGPSNPDFDDLNEDEDKTTCEEEERHYCCFFTTVKDRNFL